MKSKCPAPNKDDIEVNRTMTSVCFGFEVHQPYRLNDSFDSERMRKNRNLPEIYFSRTNQEILERVARKCYVPATEILLESLDEGFRCALSLSGTVVEQMDRWATDALDLFAQVARHPNAEILAQTYYHSLASLFPTMDEFEEQIRLHQELMKDMFGVEPRIFENTEFIFNNTIAQTANRMGFSAVYTEGVDSILGWRSPNYLYSCQGIRILMRNCQLSDDIAFRFPARSWEAYPLTADTYATWLAATPGECIHIFIDYETFGEHQWEETGILEFLRWLPQEVLEKGNECILPSQAAATEPWEEFSINETISWADREKDTSAWFGNCMQNAALRALVGGEKLVREKTIWRKLTTSDHFHYMAAKVGTCEEVHSYFRQEGPQESFSTYMRVLSDFEQRSAALTRQRGAVLGLRVFPPEQAFHFHSDYGYTGYSAFSLDEFAMQLEVCPSDSIAYHVQRGDFARWVKEVVGDRHLAERLGRCTERHEICSAVERRRKFLWNRLK
jgi:alpha-amylase